MEFSVLKNVLLDRILSLISIYHIDEHYFSRALIGDFRSGQQELLTSEETKLRVKSLISNYFTVYGQK